MSEQAATPEKSFFGVPTKGHELTALGLSLFAVFLLVQVGAPIVRDLEFLDPKLRDYFIGIAFAAFPMIHRGTKKGLEQFKSDPGEPSARDLSPWYVTGVFAAMLLFAWSQFVSFLAGMSSGVLLGSVDLQHADESALSVAVMMSAIVVSMPLCAVAAIFAGIILNRQTRSHTFLAIGLCTIVFALSNIFTSWVLAPEFFTAQFEAAAAQGPTGLAQFFAGMAFVGLVIFIFGSVGIFISRYYREKSIGRIVDAARQLTPAEREALALEINQRILAASGTQPPSAPAAS